MLFPSAPSTIPPVSQGECGRCPAPSWSWPVGIGGPFRQYCSTPSLSRVDCAFQHVLFLSWGLCNSDSSGNWFWPRPMIAVGNASCEANRARISSLLPSLAQALVRDLNHGFIWSDVFVKFCKFCKSKINSLQSVKTTVSFHAISLLSHFPSVRWYQSDRRHFFLSWFYEIFSCRGLWKLYKLQTPQKLSLSLLPSLCC